MMLSPTPPGQCLAMVVPGSESPDPGQVINVSYSFEASIEIFYQDN